MAIKGTFAEVELAGGETHYARIIWADQLRLEATAKARRWDIENDKMTTAAFLAWSALERTGVTSVSFETFRDDELVDLYLHEGRPEAMDSTANADFLPESAEASPTHYRSPLN